MIGSRLVFAGCSTATLAAAIVLQRLPHTVGVQAASDWLQLAVVALCAAAALRAARRAHGEARWFWAGIVAAVGLWGAGQVRYMVQGSAFFDGIDTVQNVLFLSVALPLLPALALHPDEAHPARTRVALDVGIACVLAVFLYVYIGLSFPSMTDAGAYARWRIGAGWFVSLAVVAGFVMRLRTAGAPWRRLYAAIGAAMAVWFVGDSVVTGLMFDDRYRPGLLDLPWLLPFVWMGLLALSWQTPPAPAPAPVDRATGWRDTRYGTVTALAAVAAPPLLDFVLALGEDVAPAAWRSRTIAVLVTTLVIAGLFLMRQWSVLAAFERTEQRRRVLRRSSEERFTRAFHGVPLGAVILAEADNRIVDVNDRALEILGGPRADAIGTTLDAADGGGAVPADAEWPQADSARGLPLRLRRASGELVDVLAWRQPLQTEGERSTLVLLQDQRETQRLQTHLIQAQKAEAVGRLAGAVAHDLNNLLTVIVGSTDVARQHLAEPAELAVDLDHVVHAADRAASLTRRLLQYGHGQAETPQAIDVAAIVREAGRTVRQLAGDSVQIVFAVPESPVQVRIERAEFERILVNLVVNARDAMPQGGRLTIAIRTELEESTPGSQAPPVGPRVALVVSDTGEGISPALLTRVFEPFFTTKAPGVGSGLGLTTVRETAQRFGGAVFITSRPGAGTTVTVRLPAADEAAAAQKPVASVPVRSGSETETVLLVEDEDAVREIVRRVLERQGYRVLEASSGPRALAMASGWPHAIDLLLTDVIMPDMNGPQLAEQLARVRPGLRVLYASGYAADALGPMGLATREVALIHKPFTPAELATRVRQTIDETV
jgi:two-component system, cell cycle sensor histidine kinase and response regulator CckA